MSVQSMNTLPRCSFFRPCLVVCVALLALLGTSIGVHATSLAVCNIAFTGSRPASITAMFAVATEYDPNSSSAGSQPLAIYPVSAQFNRTKLKLKSVSMKLNPKTNTFEGHAVITYRDPNTNATSTWSVSRTSSSSSCTGKYGDFVYESVTCSVQCQVPDANSAVPFVAPSAKSNRALIVSFLDGRCEGDNQRIIVPPSFLASLHDYSHPSQAFDVLSSYHQDQLQVQSIPATKSTAYKVVSVTGAISTESPHFDALTFNLVSTTNPPEYTTMVVTSQGEKLSCIMNGKTYPQATGLRPLSFLTYVPDRSDLHGPRPGTDQGNSGAVGDPSFTGFRGQQFQVHGTIDAVFNIVSAPALQVNALFVFLDSGVCPTYEGVLRTNCWSHPGTYFGQLGFKTADGDHLRIEAGSASEGFSTVLLNDASVVDGELEMTGKSLNVTRINSHVLRVSTKLMTFELENSDGFVNVVAVHLTSMMQLRAQRVHGLLGQTWRPYNPRKGGAVLEGVIDDYLVSSNDLFGTDFVFNRFGAEL